MKPSDIKVLVACEESQRVCMAFRARGFEAFSCDVIDCSGGHPEWHIKDDVLKHLNDGWDMMIAHPPCTYMANAGLHYLKTKPGRHQQLKEAFDFVLELWNAPIKYIAIENPTGWLNTNWYMPSQIIQPYYFGDNEIKPTCLWLKNLPILFVTQYLPKPKPYGFIIRKAGKKKGQIYNMHFHDKAGNAKSRSRTFPGIANAMAQQWGDYIMAERDKISVKGGD